MGVWRLPLNLFSPNTHHSVCYTGNADFHGLAPILEIDKIARASSGLAISLPISLAILTIFSTSLTLEARELSGIYKLSSRPIRTCPPNTIAAVESGICAFPIPATVHVESDGILSDKNSRFLILPGAFIPFLIFVHANNLAAGANLLAPSAMLADVIDYDILKTGTNRAAQYYSIMTLMAKCSMALGGAAGFYVLGLFGYDIAATAHTETTVLGLHIIYVGLPCLGGIILSYLAWIFPLDSRRHAIIRKRIEQRALRAERSQDKTQEKATLKEESPNDTKPA